MFFLLCSLRSTHLFAGLLGITLDNQNVFLVNINETIKAELNHEVLITSPSPITNSGTNQEVF